MPKGDVSVSSKMGDTGEEGVINLKKLVTSFMDGPFLLFFINVQYIWNAFFKRAIQKYIFNLYEVTLKWELLLTLQRKF